MKKYYVSHTQQHGFWVVTLNDHGHYRAVARYTNRDTAVKAAAAYNAQQSDTREQLLAVL